MKLIKFKTDIKDKLNNYKSGDIIFISDFISKHWINKGYDIDVFDVSTIKYVHNKLPLDELITKLTKDYKKLEKDIFILQQFVEQKEEGKLLDIGTYTGTFHEITTNEIETFKKIKANCNRLIICMESSGSKEQDDKIKNILEAIRYIDEVIIYHSKEYLIDLLIDLKKKALMTQGRLIRFFEKDSKDEDFISLGIVKKYI